MNGKIRLCDSLKSRLSSRDSGFTLNEILVSMALIGIAVLGFALSTGDVIRGNSRSSNVTAGTNLAHDKMEQLKAQTSWANVNNCPDKGELHLKATGEKGGKYARCWIIQDSPLGGSLKQIDVTVSWRDHKHESVTLSTLTFTKSRPNDS
ncbi:MAG: prepilin-type N-terminal cleavage/methylation domain-containing protein [Deltaproteobacteria bacterium]|nr:prepilin-type N-terminal cleavage/methylation domain-containing protein [Deltaproteobacteria bacterium]